MQAKYDEVIGSSSVQDNICKDFVRAINKQTEKGIYSEERVDEILAHVKHLFITTEDWIARGVEIES